MLKLKKHLISFALILFCVFIIYTVFTTPFFEILSLNDTLNGSKEMIDYINSSKQFGKFVCAKINNSVLADDESNNICCRVDLKLFNLITLKSFNLNTEDVQVYVGGDVMGFALNGDGVAVVDFGNVETENGKVNTIENSNIKRGDVIKQIEGESVSSIADICRIVNLDKNKCRELNVILKRGEENIDTKILNVLDKNSGIYKLGLWVKDDVSGIGTLTYVRKDNGRFGALGHAICDNDTKTVFNIENGEMYPCTIIGLKKGAKGKAGELKGLFMQGKNNKKGEVDKNIESGVFGKICDDKLLYSKDELLAGGRLYAKPGKAYIRSSIDGNAPKDYEIEIVKTNYQSSSNEKSMVIKITDKELLEKTGGIVQGMSGSPIIQNDRVIGAVTHVFLNDASRGFGVYLDWMINE